jgi:FIMAH domain
LKRSVLPLVGLILMLTLFSMPMVKPTSASTFRPALPHTPSLAPSPLDAYSTTESWYYPPDQASGNCRYQYINTCIDPTPAVASGFGYYVGHDEPAVQFFSTADGSGNNMQWQIQLPATDPTPTQDGTKVANAELYITFWFGLAACDPDSRPYGSCTPNSDSNNPATAGMAFLELQFYPPGWSCSGSQWCARMQFNSIEDQVSTCNFETFNDVFVTKSGAVGSNSGGNSDNLLMSAGDNIRVSIYDTTNGIETDINDLSSSQTGSMVASSANGFFHTDPQTCAQSAFTYHPAFKTASPSNYVGWASLAPNVDFAFEIGHWELCVTSSCSPASNLPDGGDEGEIPPGTNSPCTSLLGVGGCSSKDSDYDGTPYQADWPDGSSNHPSTLIMGSPDGNGVGPLSYKGGSYSEGYSKVHFATTVSTASAGFYPFYTQAGTGSSCKFNFGNDIGGTTTNDFGKDAQYGTTIDNPCLSGSFDFSLESGPFSTTIVNGETATYDLLATLLSGSPTSVSMSASGLPTGATPTFSPPSITPTIDGASGSLQVATSAAGPVGTFTITMQGTGGSVTATATSLLRIYDYTVTVAPSDQTVLRGSQAVYTVTLMLVPLSDSTGIFSSTLSVTGLPGDAGSSFGSTHLIPSFAGASTSLTVSTAAAPGGSLGDFTFTVNAVDVGGSTRSDTGNLHIYDYSVAVSPSDQTVLRGSGTTYTVTLTLTPGSSTTGIPGNALSTSGLPGDATPTFGSPSVAPTLGGASTTLTVQTAPGPGGSLGDYAFSVIGTDPGGMSRSGSANLHVYDFSLATNPALLQILTTGSNTFTVTLTLTPGSSTVGLPSIGLTLSGLPAGATGTFVPTSGGASGFSSVLTITTSGTASGDYTLTITGTDARSPEGGTRTFSPTLEVLTPQQALALLINQVNGLQTSGVLTGGQANALDSKLGHVIDSLNKGAVNTACNQLDAFVNQVNAYVSAGTLTQAQADQLLGGPLGAFAIMTAMGC